MLALLIGIAVAIASSPASLQARSGGAASASAEPSQNPADSSPLPSVTSAGVLGDAGHLVVGGSGTLIGLASNLAEESTDGGKSWTSLRPPSNGSGLAVDPADVHHAITGGSGIQVTADGGASWKATRTRPPGTGQYQPFLMSPFDHDVWFLIHDQKLLRTRDGSLSWKEFTTGLPPLASPVIVPGTVFGQFFLGVGNRVFQLVDNGQRIQELAALPSGVTVTELAVVSGEPPSLLARGGKDNAYLLKGTTWSVAGGGLNGPVSSGRGVLLVGNGGAKLGSPGAISYSTDTGTTWSSAIGLPYDQSVEAIGGQPSSATVFAYCYGGDLYTSTDGGHVWSLLTRALRNNTG
jgi:photosystem II stability/assembly factor-like uncharacterized protein